MITTVDGIVAGQTPPNEFFKIGTTMQAAGIMHSLLYATGRPAAAAAPAPGINGAALTTYGGQIPFTNPTAGLVSNLCQFEATATQILYLMLLDRLWHNSGISSTTTGAQAITFPGLPSRDSNGGALGVGVMAALEVSTATGNGAPVTTIAISYTNETGTAGRTATIASFPANAVAGTFVPFALQAGDLGVRSIQSITLGTSLVSGTVHLVMYRKLAAGSIVQANAGFSKDAIALLFPRMFDNTVPFLVCIPNGTTAVTIEGSIGVAQG
jgi:hypothetical protein